MECKNASAADKKMASDKEVVKSVNGASKNSESQPKKDVVDSEQTDEGVMKLCG